CRSVPQIPVLWTRIRTSLIPISGSGTSSSHRPCSGLALIRARIRAATVQTVGRQGRGGQQERESRSRAALTLGDERLHLDERLEEEVDLLDREGLGLDDLELADLRECAECGLVVRILDECDEIPRSHHGIDIIEDALLL